VLGRLTRRVIIPLILILTLPSIVLSQFHFTYIDARKTFSEAFEKFSTLGKVQLLRNVGEIYKDRPSALLWGVGPAVFNSRAFRSIAIIPYNGGKSADVAASIVTPFYRSAPSAKYIVPYFQRGIFLLSGSNTDGPFTSYVSIPIEAGIPGALLLFGCYAVIARSLIHDARRHPDKRVQTLALWSLGCLLMLLGISVADNFLEVTRYTILVWLSVSVWFLQKRGYRPRMS
jgi:hypothetical protein